MEIDFRLQVVLRKILVTKIKMKDQDYYFFCPVRFALQIDIIA